jgi:hypothetical protein
LECPYRHHQSSFEVSGDEGGLPPLADLWWANSKGEKIRAKLTRGLENGVVFDSSAEEEFEQVVVGQLLPAVAEAITAQLMLEHIDGAQEAISTSNGFWGRCLRMVERTKPKPPRGSR